MKWKASSHAEAMTVLLKVARQGGKVLEDLDIRLEKHFKTSGVVFDPSSVLEASNEEQAEKVDYAMSK